MLKINDNLIKLLQEKTTKFSLQMKSWKFLKFISKLRLHSEEILNLNSLLSLLVAANLNRSKNSAWPLISDVKTLANPTLPIVLCNRTTWN